MAHLHAVMEIESAICSNKKGRLLRICALTLCQCDVHLRALASLIVKHRRTWEPVCQGGFLTSLSSALPRLADHLSRQKSSERGEGSTSENVTVGRQGEKDNFLQMTIVRNASSRSGTPKFK